MVHKNFPLIADILRKELEPQGFHVHANTNNNEVHITDVYHVGNHQEPFVVRVSDK